MPIYQSIDSLVLLYRKNIADDWHIVNFVNENDGFTGSLTTSNLQQGEYVLGIGKPFQSSLNEVLPDPNQKIKIFPNPNTGEFTIKLNDINEDVKVSIYTPASLLVDSFSIAKQNTRIYHKCKTIKAGNYMVKLSTLNGNTIATEKMLIINK